MREVSPTPQVSPPYRERNGGDTPPLRFPLVPESRRSTTATPGETGETRPRRGGFRLPTVAKDTVPPDPHQCKPGKRRPISLAAALCARVRARAPHRGAIRAAGPFQRTPCRQPSCVT